MANNKLRRDIDAHLKDSSLNPAETSTQLLLRALVALGGPVSDSRTDPNRDINAMLIEDGRGALPELPEPEPLPAEPQPGPLVSYHGIELFLQTKAEAGRWVLTTWGSVCDGRHCGVWQVVPHGPYHFCNDHFGQLMDNIAKEHAAAVGELDAYAPAPGPLWVDQSEALDEVRGLTTADVDPAAAILPADLGPAKE